MKRILIHIIILIIILINLLLPVSCSKILFDEDIERRELHFGSFNAIEIRGIYDIILVQDSTNRLIITGKNHIQSLDASVLNDTLKIDNRIFSIEPSRNSLEIHFTALSSLITHHPVRISTADTLKSDLFCYFAFGEIEEARLMVDCNYLIVFGGHNTLGNFHVSGKTSFADLSVRYGASMDASMLRCRNAEVYNSSAGNIYVNASEKIKTYITGTGNIYYYGNPIIEMIEKTGEGRLISVR